MLRLRHVIPTMKWKRIVKFVIVLIIAYVAFQLVIQFIHVEVKRTIEQIQLQERIRINSLTNNETKALPGQNVIRHIKNASSALTNSPNLPEKPSKISKSNLNDSSDIFESIQNTTKLIQTLIESLKNKIAFADSKNLVENIESKCEEMGIEYNYTCNNTLKSCPQKILPKDLKSRLEQLVLPSSLQISKQHKDVITMLSKEIDGNFDIIVVSGLSSNHFLEAQALFKQLHEETFTTLKNFTFVVYDLGLTEEEASQVKKYCRCQFLKFPFESFPQHVRTLKCFGFKPVVVRALIEKANIVLWTDTSFRPSSAITGVIQQARTLGIQQRYYDGNNPNPSHTLEQTFYFFGDSPCAHMAFNQVAGGFGIYHNELLTKRAILDPWVACGLRSECTCPVEQRRVQSCPSPYKTKRIGLCQRNDQSSMTLILAKLFREHYRSFAVRLGKYDKRVVGNSYQYFQEIENKTRTSVV